MRRIRELDTPGFMPLYLSVFLLYGVNNVETSALPNCIIELGGGSFLAGLQNSMFVLAAIILRIPFGRLADRIGAEKMLVMGALGFLMPCIIMSLYQSIEILFVSRLLQAIGLAAFHPFVAQYINFHSHDGNAPRRIGFARFVSTLSLMVIPVLLFPILIPGAYHWFFFALSGMSLTGFLLVLPLKGKTAPHHQGDLQSESASASDRLRLMRGNTSMFRIEKQTLPLVAFPLFFSISYSILLVFGPSFMSVTYSDSNSGLLLFFISIGGLLGSLLSDRLAVLLGAKHAIMAAILTFASGMLLLAMGSSERVVVYPSAVLCGFAYNWAIVTLVSELGKRVTKSAGSHFAMQQNCLDMGIVIGSSLVGALLGCGLTLEMAFIAGSILLLSSLILWLTRYNML